MTGKIEGKGFLGKLRRFLPRGRTLKREEITELLEETINKTAEIDDNESTMLTNILGLNEITADDVMVPRAAIVSVDISEGHDAILRTIIKANHSRVPVCSGSLDNVLGFLHIKDLARCIVENRRTAIKKMLRQPIYVAPTIRALDLLEEMRLRRLHLALVVDEHGGVDGLVTIEDLVEQITGDINDEYDDTTGPVIKHHEDGSVTLDARTTLEDLERTTGVDFEEEETEEIDTVGGLVVQIAGRVPDKGEIIRHESGLEFEIVESRPRHVTTVKLGNVDTESLLDAAGMPERERKRMRRKQRMKKLKSQYGHEAEAKTGKAAGGDAAGRSGKGAEKKKAGRGKSRKKPATQQARKKP